MPTLFQPSPILQVQRLCLHLSTLKHRREWLAGAVVATVSTSVNADCDNGTALQRQAYAGLNNSRKKGPSTSFANKHMSEPSRLPPPSNRILYIEH